MSGTGGPEVVALGGGHGLAVTLRAVSSYAGRVTAVVSVADDGGSTGRLRQWWDGPAPGDIRRCLLALAGDGPDQKLWAQVLDHRFGEGDLAGHSLGNLVLVALSQILGDFGAATAEVGRLLGVSAHVLPATTGPVELCALVDGPTGPEEVRGQAKVAYSPSRVRRVWLRPPCPEAMEEAVDAVRTADQVVLGPGSLFTSVLAVCAVPAIREALAERRHGRVYVCNLDHQIPETAGLGADDHVAALEEHGVVVDTVVCDPASQVGQPSAAGPAGVDGPGAGLRTVAGWELVPASLANPNGHSHDPARLGVVLRGLAGTGPGSA